MSRRFEIWVREVFSDHDVKLFEVDARRAANDIAEELSKKTTGGSRSRIRKFDRVWVVDTEEVTAKA